MQFEEGTFEFGFGFTIYRFYQMVKAIGKF
jgi:hypothetical protein